jgi:hypothetical protein
MDVLTSLSNIRLELVTLKFSHQLESISEHLFRFSVSKIAIDHQKLSQLEMFLTINLVSLLESIAQIKKTNELIKNKISIITIFSFLPLKQRGCQ